MGAVCEGALCRSACEQQELPTVFFDFDETNVRPDQEDKVQQIALCMRAWREMDVALRGHCAASDVFSTGEPIPMSPSYAVAMSERRARSVQADLEALGIEARRLHPMGLGLSDPVCSEENEECWARNRRVEALWR